jgi:HK97 family phage portal protein
MEPKWPDNDPSVFISHYELTLDSGIYIVETRDVIHFRNGISSSNTRKGVNRLAALWREVFTDNEAAQFTSTLLYNLGIPGVTIAPANTVTQIRGDPEDIKTEFMRKTQGDKRGEPMVFTVPTDVKVLSFSPQAMDLKALRRIPEERVAAHLGVPAGVAQLGAGLDRSTFTNYSEANRAAYTQCLIPLGRLLAAELETQLLPDFADVSSGEYDVFFDYSVTEAMAEALESIWRRHESAATKGLITRADFKRAVKLPVTDLDEVYIISQNYAILPASPPRLQSIPAPVDETGAPAERAA